MKKLVLLSMVFVLSCFAKIEYQSATPQVVEKLPIIVDIRREDEWRKDGVVDGAILITFFDNRGQYDLDAFEAELSKHVKKGDKIALICRSGARSMNAAQLLDKKGYDVINLDGGVMGLKRAGYKTKAYSY